jgi:hypothetical protein
MLIFHSQKTLRVFLKVPKISELFHQFPDSALVGQYEVLLYKCCRIAMTLANPFYFEYYLNLHDKTILFPAKYKYLISRRFMISGEIFKAREAIDQSMAIDQHDYESLCTLAELFFLDQTMVNPEQVINCLERAQRIKNGALVNLLMHKYYSYKGSHENAIVHSYKAFELYLKECPMDIEQIHHF